MNIIRLEPDTWVRPDEPSNKWTERTHPIKYIVLHTTGGTDSRNWLQKWDKRNPLSDQNNVSIHYLVRRDGKIYQIAPDNTRAWHVGICQMPDGETDGNGYSLGIEMEHLNEPDYPEVQLNATAELTHNLMQKYSIPGKFVISHASCARPGPNKRKVDPVHFDWGDFWTRILAVATPTPPKPDGPASIFPYTAYSPLLSIPPIDGKKIGEHIAAKHKSPYYTPVDIKLIVSYYVKYGEKSGIDWLLALSQSIHETGWFTSWWSARPRRNPAGIGVTGQISAKKPADPQNWFLYGGLWRRGYSYESWDISVQHHIARLLCYALKDEEMTDVQREMSSILIDKSRLTRIRGCARQLIGLNGVWAVPGRTYAQTIALIANSLTKVL